MHCCPVDWIIRVSSHGSGRHACRGIRGHADCDRSHEPRGFTWGDDGTLYVALAGTGGEIPGTIDGAEIGVFGGPSSSVVTVDNGCATPLVEGIPSGNWRDASWIWGAHDVAFLDGQLYVLSAGGGIDFGNPDQPSGILRVENDGTATVVADFSTWSLTNPPAFVSPDYNPSGSLFDMEAGADRLWVSDAVGGRIITVTPDGVINLVADISDGHPVPTGLARRLMAASTSVT